MSRYETAEASGFVNVAYIKREDYLNIIKKSSQDYVTIYSII